MEEKRYSVDGGEPVTANELAAEHPGMPLNEVALVLLEAMRVGESLHLGSGAFSEVEIVRVS